MNYIIDTQILLWFILGNDKLKPPIFEILINRRNNIYVSQISLFEIAIKQSVGKLAGLKLSIEELARQLKADNFEI